MSLIADEIKYKYDDWNCGWLRVNNPFPICDSAPFISDDFWIYYYLFPELLIVYDEHAKDNITLARAGVYIKGDGSAKIFPCWLVSEEDILRVMGECGIL